MSLPAPAALVTLGAAITRATTALAAAGVEAPRREVRLLASHVLGKDAAWVFSHPEQALAEVDQRILAAVVARRAGREPLSRITGMREFWSLPFHLTPDTLDPRPDSETLVEAVLDALPDRAARLSLLDLGTGSGCLLLALLSELPNARGLGVDINPGAAAAAARNAHALGLADRANFVAGDWGDALAGRFDAILVNPPYIPDGEIDGLEPEVARWEPRRALAGGADGLDALRALAPALVKLIAPKGVIAVELGLGQDDSGAAICRDAGLDVVARPTDLSGRVRSLLMRSAKAG